MSTDVIGFTTTIETVSIIIVDDLTAAVSSAEEQTREVTSFLDFEYDEAKANTDKHISKIFRRRGIKPARVFRDNVHEAISYFVREARNIGRLVDSSIEDRLSILHMLIQLLIDDIEVEVSTVEVDILHLRLERQQYLRRLARHNRLYSESTFRNSAPWVERKKNKAEEAYERAILEVKNKEEADYIWLHLTIEASRETEYDNFIEKREYINDKETAGELDNGIGLLTGLVELAKQFKGIAELVCNSINSTLSDIYRRKYESQNIECQQDEIHTSDLSDDLDDQVEM